MVHESAIPFLPKVVSLTTLRNAVTRCKGCPLYLGATQAVFGEGPKDSRLLLIGEQPGNDEDIQGRPFVGPAGKLLDKALADAGIPRADVYVTNAVKHFKFEERGKRRIHQKPSTGEVIACQPWLEAEVRTIKPTVLVCLGATAARTVFGSGFQLLKNRGRAFKHEWAPHAVATLHPSAILRIQEPDDRREEYSHLVQDLKAAGRLAVA